MSITQKQKQQANCFAVSTSYTANNCTVGLEFCSPRSHRWVRPRYLMCVPSPSAEHRLAISFSDIPNRTASIPCFAR